MAINSLGIDALARGAYEEAEQHWVDALGYFERGGNPAEQANVLRNLAFLPRLSRSDERAILEAAMALVLPARHLRIEGQVRAKFADLEYVVGNYAASSSQLERAIGLFERALVLFPGDPQTSNGLARALTSRGRLQRLLGRSVEADADHYRAAEILEGLHDWTGASQAYHALALTRRFNDREDDAVGLFEKAVALARLGGDRGRLAAALAQAAISLQRTGSGLEAIALLEEADTVVPDGEQSLVDSSSAFVLDGLGRPADALIRIDRALAAERSADSMIVGHGKRATILERLGRMEEAIDASARAVELIETIRPSLTPEDDAKRGYIEVRGSILNNHVNRLARAGRLDDALEAAERARGRAFLDLLASTDLRPNLSEGSRIAAVSPVTRNDTIPSLATPPRGIALWLQTRRGAPVSRRAPAPEPDIASIVVAEPLTLAAIKSQASRLGTHIVSYWVMPRQSLVWVVAPNGRTTSVAVDVSEERLRQLSQQASTTSAGVPTRGDGRLTFGGDAALANRELYRLLIAPIRSALPAPGRSALPAPGGLLTLIPHGPLFQLPFAAFATPAGRYLIEDFAIHYAPSVSALAFTARRLPRSSGPALVVADPAFAPELAKANALERLPGAAREGELVAGALGGETAALLRSSSATEFGFRERAAAARVIHMATHAIVRDDRPFESFLAMAGSESDPANDGRLMMGEVYGLQLDAQLVVLSACRSAGGRVTGDGIVGLSRGFFAAGAPSVMASLWDLPDAVTTAVFPSFYATWLKGASRAESLRQAQLKLLRDLRAGRVSVESPAGRFTLPEHPSLWAGLVLLGEP